MIIRWLLYGGVFGVCTLLGYIIVPLIYPIRNWVISRKIKPLYWFIDTSEPYDENDIDFGIYGRFKHNFIGYFQQCAMRNPTHNLKLDLSPPKGEKKNLIGELRMISTQWNKYVGKTRATYTINGIKCFRISALIPIFNKWYFHYKAGYGDHWYIYVIKLGKL